MNDPHLAALIYTVNHGSSISYENACPLSYDEHPEFHLTVDNKIARFEFKKHYADTDEARNAIREIEAFVQHWEFDAALRRGPNSFSLHYEGVEMVDRNPSPSTPTSGTTKFIREPHLLGGLSVKAILTLVEPHYPSPPPVDSVEPDDPDVKSMYDRYVNHESGGELLPSFAYFCLTMLEYEFRVQGHKDVELRKKVAEKYHISRKVLSKIADLSARGDPSVARKITKSGFIPLAKEEEKFLKKAAREIICRAAQVANDEDQPLCQITKACLPKL